MTATRTKNIPVILTAQALKSLRDSGYTLAAAIGEPIDNSLEASATTISILLQERTNSKGKKHVDQIVIIDDGSGMTPAVLEDYRTIGYSTRYMSTKTIGKYGVGAKLAALNYCTRFDTWSRTTETEEWLHVCFDLVEIDQKERRGEEVRLEPLDNAPIPEFLNERIPSGSGTIILWSEVDRLEEGMAALDVNSLRVELEKELSRMFRYYIEGGHNLFLNDTKLLPHDPLFLMSNTWADQVLENHYNAITVLDEAIAVGQSTARLRVTVYPKEVVRKRGKGRDTLAKELRIPENLGAISFVRLNREISYTNVPRILPGGVKDVDRHIGIEVCFSPELDASFGVRNVKRGAEPQELLRRKIRDHLKQAIPTARSIIQDMFGRSKRKPSEKQSGPTPMEEAVKTADEAMPKGRAKGPETKEQERQILDDLAKDVGIQDEGEKSKYLERIKELPFIIVSVDFPGSNFVEIRHLSDKVIIRLNTRHRFYREMWEPIQKIAKSQASEISGEVAVDTARRTDEALTLLLVSYGKAESMDKDPDEKYGNLRNYWGQFLDTMMSKVKNVL